MKSISTRIGLSLFAFIVLCLSNGALAQTSVNVTASGGSFSPGTVNVYQGDTVRWTNTSGTHNVNGTIASYPNNPEPFGNSLGTGWTYEYVFTLDGTYDYQVSVLYN